MRYRNGRGGIAVKLFTPFLFDKAMCILEVIYFQGDRPTPLTEDPYEMVKMVFRSRPPGMSEERFRELRNIIKKMPTESPIPADERSRRARYVGGRSGAVGGTTVAAGGVVTTGVSAVIGGGSAAAMAAPLVMAAGPAAAIGGAVGAATGHLLRHTNLSEENQRVAVGGSSGSSAGVVIGAVLGGPIGAAAGGAAGAVVGAAIWKIREWWG